MYINLFWFLLSFTIGLFYIYITNPPRNIIYKFPSPINSKNTIYRDNSNLCYKFVSTRSECPINKELIKEQPDYEEIY
jgi:hypothetical protein